MDVLKIEATKYTPEILFDEPNNLFEMKGDSYPEDIDEFYGPILSRLEHYLEQRDKQKFIVNMEFIYFNSGTTRVLTDIFDMLNETDCNESVIVNWIYEEDNESAEELGEDFQEDMENLEFNLVRKP